jgi:hypothetical protein
MGWVVNAIPRPLYPWERDQVPIVQEAEWAEGRSEQVRKISAPPGFDPRTVAIQTTLSRLTAFNS